MDNFIEKNKRVLKIILLAMFLLPILVNALFSNWSFTEQIENLWLGVIMVLLGAGGAFFVLGLQVINPSCSRKLLRFACNFFIVMFSLSLLFPIPMIWDCIYKHQGIGFFSYVLFGFLIVTNWIKERYALKSSRFKV